MKIEARLRALPVCSSPIVLRRGGGTAHQPARGIETYRRSGEGAWHDLIERRSGALTAAGDFLASHVLRADAILAQPRTGSAPCASRDWAPFNLGCRHFRHLSSARRHRRLPTAHPGVRVNFQLGTSAEVVNAVRSHHAEIGVAGGLLAAPEIEAEPLIEDEIVIVGPRAFKGKRLSRDDLESLTWISREEGSATRVVADNALAELGIVPKRRLALPAGNRSRSRYGAATVSQH